MIFFMWEKWLRLIDKWLFKRSSIIVKHFIILWRLLHTFEPRWTPSGLKIYSISTQRLLLKRSHGKLVKTSTSIIYLLLLLLPKLSCHCCHGIHIIRLYIISWRDIFILRHQRHTSRVLLLHHHLLGIEIRLFHPILWHQLLIWIVTHDIHAALAQG